MRYKTDSKIKVVMDRVDYDSRAAERQVGALVPWELADEDDGPDVCGNVSAYFDRGRAIVGVSYSEARERGLVSSYEQISSALALYRLVSWLQSPPNVTPDYYKLNWGFRLRHRETGAVLELSEWKGGFNIRTPATYISGLPKEYVRDAQELLTVLVSTKFTLGYDGTIAGSVA